MNGKPPRDPGLAHAGGDAQHGIGKGRCDNRLTPSEQFVNNWKRCSLDCIARIVDKRWGNLSTIRSLISISVIGLPCGTFLRNALFRTRKIFGGNRFHHFFHMALNTEKGARGIHHLRTLPLRLRPKKLPHCFPLTLKIAFRLNHIFPLLLRLFSLRNIMLHIQIYRSTPARSAVHPTTVYILRTNVREWQSDLGKGM